jgi:hypothetical protein
VHILHVFVLILCLLAVCLVAEKSFGKAEKKEILNLILYVTLVCIKMRNLPPS